MKKILFFLFAFLAFQYTVAQSIFERNAGSTLAASNIRNLDCSSYEVYLIDYGCGKFNKKVHIME